MKFHEMLRNSEKKSLKSSKKTVTFGEKDAIFAKNLEKIPKILGKILLNFQIRAVQRCDNLVELEKCFPTSIWLQNFVSIQQRTSLDKFEGEFLTQGETQV